MEYREELFTIGVVSMKGWMWLDKKVLEQDKKKSLASYIYNYYKLSISVACRLLSLYRCYFYYCSMKDDKAVEGAIKDASKFWDGF